jgi:hypothetical protein
MNTWEITGVLTSEQIRELQTIGTIERLDANTINVECLSSEDEDAVVEYCEENGLTCRLV